MTTTTLFVDEMSCQNCVRHIGEALDAQVPPVERTIDLATRTVTVTYDPAATSLETITQALDEAGYPAVPA